MTKVQIVVLSIALALFAGLYFGFDTKPKERQKLEQSRSISGESTSIENLLADADEHLTPEQKAQVAELQQQLEKAGNDKSKAAVLKKISAFWYEFGNFPISGNYADQVAEIENADTSWSVAGAIYYNGLIKIEDPQLRDFCAKRAVKAFESAASLNTAKPEHQVNLALVYAENPPPDNPMKAVLALRDLEKKYPESPAVYNALGRLAIKTGQWQRAIDRFEKSWSLDKTNPNTPCLLSKSYQEAGNGAKAEEFAKLCK